METSKSVPDMLKSQVNKTISIEDGIAQCFCVVCISVYFGGIYEMQMYPNGFDIRYNTVVPELFIVLH